MEDTVSSQLRVAPQFCKQGADGRARRTHERKDDRREECGGGTGSVEEVWWEASW